MKILKIYPNNPDSRYIEFAVDSLKDEKIIVIPTDSGYAFAANALSADAIAGICKIKNIDPLKHTLSIICDSISQVSEYAKIENPNFSILKDNLPGPFTFILPTLSKLPKAFKHRKVAGFRIPDNKIPGILIRESGLPLIVSSIPVDESEDSDYACEPELIAERFNMNAELILDCGRIPQSHTAVVDLTGSEPVEIREGSTPLIV